MFGKVNLTQAEDLTMVAVRVIFNDVGANFAAIQVNFDFNVYKPVLISSFLELNQLMYSIMISFVDNMIFLMTINTTQMQGLRKSFLNDSRFSISEYRLS